MAIYLGWAFISPGRHSGEVLLIAPSDATSVTPQEHGIGTECYAADGQHTLP